MPLVFRATFTLLLLALVGCTAEPSVEAPDPAEEEALPEDGYDPDADTLRFAGEVRLRNIRQLTFGGNNAEAYWSPDDELLIFQSDWDAINPQGCDQQFVMRANGEPFEDGERYHLVSTGEGRTTCGYFLRDGRILFSSTHAAGPECPAPIPSEPGVYAWPLYPSFDIYTAEADGSNLELLIGGDSYDAEATLSPDGRYIVFTSTRSGDLDLWRYDLETEELLQLTDEIGYDGGAFFSPDGSKIVWRAARPEGEERERYQELLAKNLIHPSELDIYIADADGQNARRVTNLPAANWAPFFHPSGEKIIFSSNHHDPSGRLFDLFLVDLDGGNLEQITHSGTFDSFPMFSHDGSKLAFSSNRRADRQMSRETNVFIADWIEAPTAADSSFQTLPAR